VEKSIRGADECRFPTSPPDWPRARESSPAAAVGCLVI
jgi:hypothetical protein